MSNDPLIGRVLADRYRILAPIGEGGMGRVYVAEHVKMGRKSAVKVMSPGLALSADAIGRFHREAANASRINHPNVAAIYDFGEAEGGLLYLAMELIEGETLAALIRREGRLPVARAADVLRQAADALAAAHHLGIVHRDLKPDNIMLARHIDGSDWVKVVDFGIAKATEAGGRGSQTLTTAGVSIGTPDYMSPEQLAGDRLDARTDVYALGLVLFNMLTGELPYPRLTSKETLVRRLTAPPRTLSDVRPELTFPAALQAALDGALAPEPADRFADATSLGRAVTSAASAPGDPAAGARTVRLSAPPTAPQPRAPTAAMAAPTRRGGWRRAAALVAVAAAAAGALVALRPRAGGGGALPRVAPSVREMAAANTAVAPSMRETAAANTAVAPSWADTAASPVAAPAESIAVAQAGAPVRSASPPTNAVSRAAPRRARPTRAATGVYAASTTPVDSVAGAARLDPLVRAQADSALALLRQSAVLLGAGDVRGARLELREAGRAGVVFRQQLGGAPIPADVEAELRRAVREVVAACASAKARGAAPELAAVRCEALAQHSASDGQRGPAGSGEGAMTGGWRARRQRVRGNP